MAQVLTRPPSVSSGQNIDLDFRDTASWGDFSGIPLVSILFGDEEAGPFVFLSSSEPMEEMMPLGFSHSHPSDNWRISVRGTTNMGPASYAQGQFRFHDGGVPYASDNLTWGPDGGFGLVLMGDRRGFAITPVKAKLAETMKPQQQAVGDGLGIDMCETCVGAPAISTTLGETKRAHLEGGFDSTEDWIQIQPGVRVALGLLGEPERGPVICMVSAEPGAVLWPARTLDTETLVLPIEGSVMSAGETLDQGSIRLEAAGVATEAFVAGPEGAGLVAIVGDRRALAAALQGGGFDDADFAGKLGQHLTDLLGA